MTKIVVARAATRRAHHPSDPTSDSDPVTGGYDGTTFTRPRPMAVSFRGE